MGALQRDQHYTYADYEQWDDYPRCELINGVIYLMSAPSRIHQQISIALSSLLYNYLKGKTCEVFHAPFDVRLNYDTDDNTVVQPDILVVCDMSKLENGKTCNGAPDFVIEILSPSTERHDAIKKLNLYLQAGVKEYWLVDPEHKLVATHRLIDNQYVTSIYDAEDEILVMVLEGCTIRLSEVFV